MFRPQPLHHVLYLHSTCRAFITPRPFSFIRVRQIQNHIHGHHVHTNASQTPQKARKLEADTHSPREYVVFAVLLSCIASYAIYERYNRDPSSPHSRTPLNDRTFVPFLLVAKDSVSSTSSIYTLRRGSSSSKDPYAHLWGSQDEIKVSSVEFKQPQLQISRAYTPLPPADDTDSTDLRFLIRREKGGEMSNYLDGLRVGATVEVRGPKVEWRADRSPDEVVFLAGGTGIVPAMQVVRSLMGEDNEEAKQRRPRIRILWANRRREDCMGGYTKGDGERRDWWLPFSGAVKTPDLTPNRLVSELETMVRKYDGDLTIEYLVDEEKTFIDRRRILQSTSKKSDLESATAGAKLLLVSGPDGFVEHFVGPKGVEGGVQVQGPVRGVIGQLGLKGWTIVKL